MIGKSGLKSHFFNGDDVIFLKVPGLTKKIESCPDNNLGNEPETITSDDWLAYKNAGMGSDMEIDTLCGIASIVNDNMKALESDTGNLLKLFDNANNKTSKKQESNKHYINQANNLNGELNELLIKYSNLKDKIKDHTKNKKVNANKRHDINAMLETTTLETKSKHTKLILVNILAVMFTIGTIALLKTK